MSCENESLCTIIRTCMPCPLPYKREVCAIGFKTSSDLKRHIYVAKDFIRLNHELVNLFKGRAIDIRAAYSVGVTPLFPQIKNQFKATKTKHVAFADGVIGAERLRQLREWYIWPTNRILSKICFIHGYFIQRRDMVILFNDVTWI